MTAEATGSAAPAANGTVLSALIRSVAEDRDKAAFAELFRHFAPRLKSYLLRLGSDPGAAEELAQETMVLVWRKAVLYDPAKATASTWIFTIARNARVDAFRRERRPEIDAEDPALVPDSPEPPDEAINREQSAAQLAEAMKTLSEGEKEILHLSFFEDLSHSMIAERLSIPLGTVKSRIRLAFGKLRSALSEAEGAKA